MKPFSLTAATIIIAVIGTMAAVRILSIDHQQGNPRLSRVVFVTAKGPERPHLLIERTTALESAEPAALIADGARLFAARPTVAMPSDLRMLPARPSVWEHRS